MQISVKGYTGGSFVVGARRWISAESTFKLQTINILSVDSQQCATRVKSSQKLMKPRRFRNCAWLAIFPVNLQNAPRMELFCINCLSSGKGREAFVLTCNACMWKSSSVLFPSTSSLYMPPGSTKWEDATAMDIPAPMWISDWANDTDKRSL